MSPAPAFGIDEARDLVIAAADNLFYERGVGAVTMGDIRDRSGVSLRRIYTLFPAKSDLVTAWLSHRHEEWLQWFSSEITSRRANGDDAVNAIFDTIATWLESTERRGCAFLNTLAETADLTTEHREIISVHKSAVIDVLAPHSPDPAAVAVLLDGAIVRSAAVGNTSPIDAARRAANQLSAAWDAA